MGYPREEIYQDNTNARPENNRYNSLETSLSFAMNTGTWRCSVGCKSNVVVKNWCRTLRSEPEKKFLKMMVDDLIWLLVNLWLRQVR